MSITDHDVSPVAPKEQGAMVGVPIAMASIGTIIALILQVQEARRCLEQRRLDLEANVGNASRFRFPQARLTRELKNWLEDRDVLEP